MTRVSAIIGALNEAGAIGDVVRGCLRDTARAWSRARSLTVRVVGRRAESMGYLVGRGGGAGQRTVRRHPL